MVSDIGISLTSKHFGTLPKKSSELHMHHSLLQGRTSSDMKGFLIKVLVWNIISFTWKGFKQNDLGRTLSYMQWGPHLQWLKIIRVSKKFTASNSF
jgi:hypothetical protein